MDKPPALSRSSRSPLFGHVVIVVAALILLGGTSAGLVAWKLWNDAQATARQEGHNLGVMFAEQTHRSLQAASIVLREFEAMAEQSGARTPQQLALLLGSHAFYDTLTSRERDLPQAAALAIVGADGALVNTSRAWPVPATNLAGRDYVAFCRQPSHPGLFIGAIDRGQGNEPPAFTLARCLSGADDSLLGIAVALMRAEYFMDFYQTIGLPEGTNIAVRRANGDALIRYPRTGPDAPARLADAGDDSHYVATLPLASYPMRIDVGLSRAHAVQQWRRQFAWVVLGSLCAVVSVLILLQRLMSAVAGLTRARDALVQRNDALVRSRLRLERQAIDLADGADALRESEARLSKQSAVLQTTLDHMDQGLMMVAADRTVAVCNRQAIDMLNLPPALMETKPDFGQVLAQQWQMEEFQAATPELKAFVRGGGLLDEVQTYERRRPNGTILEVRSVPLQGGGLVRTFTDITQRKLAEERLTYIAYHDELTGLANRYALQAALDRALAAASASGTTLAVLYVDLDRFKLINDTHGHAVGDRLLHQVGQRIAACLREGDTVARLGGDEFAAVLPADADRTVALDLAERVKAAVGQPYDLAAEQCRVGVSIGIALHPADGTTAETLLRSADSALYRAKAAGRNAVCLHETGAEQEDRTRFILEQDLRLALAGDQFELVYQPIVDAESGLPAALEALVRWRHPTRGLLTPDQFIPIAEQIGVIDQLGNWVMRTACAEAATWAVPLRLAINLSSLQFAQTDLEQQVVDVLETSGMAADRLDLEVTESVLISDNDQVRHTMLALRRRGIHLVMDDFGTGHSSLKTLQGFPFQQIKIDRSFVANIEDESGAGAIVQAVLAMASSMKLEVVAEGIETRAQADTLRRLGCRYLQGFLLYPPQSPEWVRDYLWRWTASRNDNQGAAPISTAS